METTTNVELAREIFDVLNRRDYARVADYCAEDLIVTSGEGVVKGPDAVIAYARQNMLEFPDTVFTIVDTLIGESKVGVEYVFTGTNTGELDMGPGMGKLPPTGKQVRVPGFWVFTFKDGKVTSIAQYADMLSLLMQLGVTPTPALAPA